MNKPLSPRLIKLLRAETTKASTRYSVGGREKTQQCVRPITRPVLERSFADYLLHK